MATINDAKLFLEYLLNKEQSGNSMTPEQFNLSADRAMMQVFNNHYKMWLVDGVSSTFLGTFIQTTTFSVPTTGRVNLPSDYQFMDTVNHYYARPDGGGDWIPVSPVGDRDFNEITSSQLKKPTRRFPKYCEYSTFIEIVPRSLGMIRMDYFRKPATPVWGYTGTSNPVYNSATSTQFECSDAYLNEILSVMAGYAGINLRESDLVAWTQGVYKQENK